MKETVLRKSEEHYFVDTKDGHTYYLELSCDDRDEWYVNDFDGVYTEETVLAILNLLKELNKQK